MGIKKSKAAVAKASQRQLVFVCGAILAFLLSFLVVFVAVVFVVAALPAFPFPFIANVRRV